MSNECQRKFGVERITSYDDFHNVICKDCGERYGRHVGIECPPVKERSERSPVERGVIKLVICDHIREDCSGCPHAIAHEPIRAMNQEICTDTDRCAFHEIRVQCKEVL